MFDRNARFAVKRPVPGLGDKNTPMDEVYAYVASIVYIIMYMTQGRLITALIMRLSCNNDHRYNEIVDSRREI